jgi:hypothetical protein
MTGLDCNILVQLALQDRPANSATVAAFKAEVAVLLHSAGAKRLLTSNPADFTVFGVFEIISP